MPTSDTAQQGWETLFWQVFERSRSPMALMTEDLEYVDVNPVHAQIYGRSREDVVGTRLDDYLPPDEAKTLARNRKGYVCTGELSGERKYVRADGSVVRVEYAAYAEEITGRRLGLFVSQIVDEEDQNGIEPEVVAANGEGLSPREGEVVRLVALGMTSRQIAEELTVSTETVRTHIRNALAKTGTRTRAQLVAKVMARGALTAS
jgi:PAS domain S-box-containing protein